MARDRALKQLITQTNVYCKSCNVKLVGKLIKKSICKIVNIVLNLTRQMNRIVEKNEMTSVYPLQ